MYENRRDTVDLFAQIHFAGYLNFGAKKSSQATHWAQHKSYLALIVLELVSMPMLGRLNMASLVATLSVVCSLLYKVEWGHQDLLAKPL